MAVPDLEAVKMSPAEREKLQFELRRTQAYFEFGMGGSSLLAVRAGVREIVSIDSDPQWVLAVRQHAEIAPRIADGTASILHADIGPVAEWGRPADRNRLTDWQNYLSIGWRDWAQRGTFPDLVLVDGRFRVACCLATAMVWLQQRSDNLRVLIHDVSDQRLHYRDVLDFYEEVEIVETLLMMKPRSDISASALLSELLTWQFDFT